MFCMACMTDAPCTASQPAQYRASKSAMPDQMLKFKANKHGCHVRDGRLTRVLRRVNDSRTIRVAVNAVVWSLLIISCWLLVLTSILGLRSIAAAAMFFSIVSLFLAWPSWGIVGAFVPPLQEVSSSKPTVFVCLRL